MSKEAVTLAKRTNHTEGRAKGLRTLGFSYIRISKDKKALQYLQNVLTLFEALNDDTGRSGVCKYFGIV